MPRHEYPGFTYPEDFAHKPLEKKIHKLSPGIYAFAGYGDSVFSIVLGQGGYILIDTGSNAEGAEEAKKEIAAITKDPLAAVILTHGHPDHLLGGEAFLAGLPGPIPVWGRANFGSEQAGLKGLENIAGLRAGRQFAVSIPDDKYTFNSMLYRKPGAAPGKRPVPAAPNTFMDGDSQKLNIAGVELELIAAPGETTDHLAVWLPREKALFTGDSMYRSFPNIYPLRGTGFRDLSTWAATLRRLAGLEPRIMVMGHNEPESGGDCAQMLLNYAEAIQFVLDETVNGMNKGLTPDELVLSVQLPAHLRNLSYLAEYYGSVPWTVRSVFSGLLGWFDGNPSKLVPLPPKDEARRMADMAGGTDKLLERAEAALKDEDYRWAAQLCDYLLLLNEPADPEAMAGLAAARRIKADALEALSGIVLPITGKNYLMACALELRKQG